MARFKVEVYVPCTAVALVEAASAEEAFEKVNQGECFWPGGNVPKPDWKGAEVTHATNLDTGEETEG